MTIPEWMMIGAVLLGPILAVQVQKYIEMLREKRGRRLQIFHTLMATRAARTSLSHVEALNRIDLEFHAPAFRQPFYQAAGARSVGEAWKLYRDHLNTRYDEHELQAWGRRGNELFTDLLYQMGKSLGYEFDKVELSKGVYSPIAHGQEQLYQAVAREWFSDVVTGKKAIPVRLVTRDEALVSVPELPTPSGERGSQ